LQFSLRSCVSIAAGDGNTAVGTQVLLRNTTGSQNTAVGTLALVSNTTGRNNIALGFEAGSGVSISDNVICIGAGVVGDNVDNSCFIGNIATSTSPNGIAVLINSTGRLGTITSSARFKDEIQPMDKASEALFALKPVAFRYKKDIDPARTPQLGLVAEDVEKVNPDLIVRDKEGKPYSVRYEQVNAMLLNEFLKGHKTVNEQGAMIARQQKAIEALTAGLKKVSAQLAAASPSRGGLEESKSAPQTVSNDK
jgi:trimeric autotransporter adhesin